MVEQQRGHIPSLALGIHLLAGHVHARQKAPTRRKAPPRCHCLAIRRNPSSNNSVRSARERQQIPPLPQLRALQTAPQDASVSENSLPSTPRSGHQRAHPYGPIGEVAEGSSCKLVPSTTTQAPCATGTDESMNTTSIARSRSSPLLSLPEQFSGIGKSQTWLFQSWLFAIFTQRRSFVTSCVRFCAQFRCQIMKAFLFQESNVL